MATEEETKKFLKSIINETLDERDAAAKKAAEKKAEEDAKNNPPQEKGFLDRILGG